MKLNGSINADQQTISIVQMDLLSYPTTIPFDILIDYELMSVTSILGSGFCVVRGSKGSKATAHDDQTVIYNPLLKRTHNEPLGLRDSSGNKILIGPNLTLDATNTLNAMTGGGDLSSSGSYADPSWITSLAGSKITNIAESQVTNLVNDLNAKEALANKNANNGYCGLDSSGKIAGSKITGNITGNAAGLTANITESQVTSLVADLSAKEATANKNQNSGYCGLDSSGHVALEQLPAAISGALQYQGTWNALANSPALVSSTGTTGFFYKVSTGGTTTLDGVSLWRIGDLVIFDGTVWDKIDNYEAVTSVNSLTGAVSLASTNLTDTASIILSTNTYDDPSWLNSLNASKLTGSIVATNGVVTNGSYSNPTWLTSILGSVISGDIAGNAASINGVITESQVTNLISDLSAKEVTANKNQNNGYCGLDVTGKVDPAQLPSALSGSLTYKGSWNATTNTPTLTSSVGTAGYFYKVSVAGTTTLDGISSWAIGDQVIFDGNVWSNIPAYEAVASVNGLTGIVSLASTNLTDTSSIILSSNNYSDPSWLTGLAFSKITGSIIATNGVVTTTTYNNPAWLGSIDGSIVSGDITGNAASINGSIIESQVTNLVTDLSAKEVTVNKNANNGYCGLDSGGKVLTAQLPAAIIGSVNYRGVWNALSNTPTLTSSVGTKGDYYVVSVAGSTSLDGLNSWHLGDWAVFNGATWNVILNYQTIISVNGQTGAVSLASTNLTNSSAIVLNTNAYANPSWITSLDASKITGTIAPANAVLTTNTYANPSWLTSLAFSKITGTIVATNGVVTTGTYPNPSWLTTLAGSKITGNITGTAGGLSANIAQSQVTNLVTALAAKAPLVQSLISDTDSSTVTFDLSASLLHQVTIGNNRTLALSNAVVGQRFVIILKQDNTGSRTVTWFSGIIWSGSVPTLNPSPNKYDTFEFICIATNTYIGKVLQSEVYNRPCLLG